MPFLKRSSPSTSLTLSSFLWPFIRAYRWAFLATLLLAIAAMLVETSLWPSLLRIFLDAMLRYQATTSQMLSFASFIKTEPFFIFLGLMGAWVLMDVVYRLYGFCNAWLFPRFEAAVRKAMLQRLMEHSHAFFANHPSGSMANKVNDISRGPTRIFIIVIGQVIPVLCSILVVAAIFSRLNYIFAGVFLSWAILHISIALYFAPRCNKRSEIHAATRSAVQGRIVDIFSNMVAVRIFSRQSFEYSEFLPGQDIEQQQQVHSLLLIEQMKIVLGFTSALCIGIGEIGGALFAWSRGTLTLGEAILIVNACWGIMGMLWMLSNQLPELFKEIGVCKQALSLLQTAPEIQDVSHAKTLEVCRGDIFFDNVVFDYAHSKKLTYASLNPSEKLNPNFIARRKTPPQTIHLKASEKVGLVGESGGGKTTFVQLILRYYDLHAGRILIDGQDIREVTQASLRENVSFIPQDPLLFHRSVLENIRYGSPHASDEAVYEAARLARCDGFIGQLSHGYHTQVGERGVKLSGGQRQRIAIARAFLKNAKILILDEATSALDSLTEAEIQESLYSLSRQKQNCTTLVIAHRLSTLLDMDRILVFHRGEIVEDGAHQDLIAMGGRYAKLWEMQRGNL